MSLSGNRPPGRARISPADRRSPAPPPADRFLARYQYARWRSKVVLLTRCWRNFTCRRDNTQKPLNNAGRPWTSQCRTVAVVQVEGEINLRDSIRSLFEAEND